MGRAEPRTPEPLRPPVYRAFMLLGGANLTPWMTFLAMADYFDRERRPPSTRRDASHPAKPPMHAPMSQARTVQT